MCPIFPTVAVGNGERCRPRPVRIARGSHRTWLPAQRGCPVASTSVASGRMDRGWDVGGVGSDLLFDLPGRTDAARIVEPSSLIHRLPVLSALSSAPLGHVLAGSFFFAPPQPRAARGDALARRPQRPQRPQRPRPITITCSVRRRTNHFESESERGTIDASARLDRGRRSSCGERHAGGDVSRPGS